MRIVNRVVRGVLTAVAVVGAVLTLQACGGTDGPTGLKGFVPESANDVGGISLPDIGPVGMGSERPLTAAPGDLLLVYFGYTSCPDVCPTTLGDIRSAIRRLPAKDRQRVEVAMATVDPTRDTAAVLRGYVGHFFSLWRAYRTTDPAALMAAEDAFGASSSVTRAKGGGQEVMHSAFTYVVDDQGHQLVSWPFGMRSKDMAADLRTLLSSNQGAQQ
jgi:protein SCO1/2